MAKYALPVYRASGKLKPQTLALFVGGIVAGCGVALVYQTLLRWIPFIYVNLLVVAGFGGALAFAGWQAVKWGHCRNVLVACALALPLGAVPLAASYYWDWQHAISTVAEKNPTVSKEEIAQELTFARFLDIKKEAGWTIKSASGAGRDKPDISGVGVVFLWVIEGLIVVGMVVFVVAGAASKPYCERCGRWSDDRSFHIPGATRADADGPLQRGDFAQLVQLRPGGDADPTLSLHFTVTTCASCSESAWLTVAEHKTVQKKKETKTSKQWLIQHAVLPGGQREAVVDCVQAVVGQKLAV